MPLLFLFFGQSYNAHFWNYDGKQTFLKFSPFGVWFLNWSYHAAGPVYWPNVWPPGDEEEHFPECNSPPKCSAEREAGAGWSNDRVGDSGWDCNVWTIILHYNLQLPTVVLIFYFYFVVQYVYCQLFLKWKLKLITAKEYQHIFGDSGGRAGTGGAGEWAHVVRNWQHGAPSSHQRYRALKIKMSDIPGIIEQIYY